MTLLHCVLNKTAVSPKYLGHIGQREGQIGETGGVAIRKSGWTGMPDELEWLG